jgi:hypothetical protein
MCRADLLRQWSKLEAGVPQCLAHMLTRCAGVFTCNLSAAGEFLGSLVQMEDGLRKLNIHEEVRWWSGFWEGGGTNGDLHH